MALNNAQLTWIQIMSNLSKQQLLNKATTDEVNILWNSGGGWLSTIQQADLDGSKFAGLQLSDLNAAVGALTGAISNDIVANTSFLAKLAAAGGN